MTIDLEYFALTEPTFDINSTLNGDAPLQHQEADRFLG